MELLVDLADLIDVEAEIAKKRDELSKLEARIAAQRRSSPTRASFSCAPAAVVEKERAQLESLLQQQATVSEAIAALRSSSQGKRPGNTEQA